MKAEIELSERLRRACEEKGITEPMFVAQDNDGQWNHYDQEPFHTANFWHGVCGSFATEIMCDVVIKNWRETLMEFVTPKIEAGKRYWRRDGEISGVAELTSSSQYYPFTVGGNWYSASGSWNIGVISGIDLIAEYREEAISARELLEMAQYNRDLIMGYYRETQQGTLLKKTLV